MVRNQGGLWDTSMQIYPNPRLGGFPKETTLEWDFPAQTSVKFAHLQYESDVLSWQGAQIPLIIFDELTHFTRAQFFYMLSRNRSTCGVKPYIRATTNPDADSWVREFIDWYIDPETGYAIPERSGKIRWFIMLNDTLIWGDSKREVQEKYPDSLPKSFTFISASIYDNKKLLAVDPGYLANLHALPRVERERLLNGNWNIKPSAGLYFQKGYFEIVDAVPHNKQVVRYWDRAATKKTDTNDPDYTVGIRLEKDINNILYITDMVRIQESPLNVQNIIKNTAIRDGLSVRIGLEEDPGQAGVADAEHLTRVLQGFNVKRNKVMKDKVTRALPVSAQSEAGNIKVLRAKWNDDLFRELENFPEGNHDDIVDALSGAFLMINQSSYNLTSLAR
jgi:predicted phage terminase large subunit-like protein